MKAAEPTQVLRLRRVAVAHQCLDELLALLHLPAPHERHPEEVRHGAVVGPLGGERPQQRLDGGRLAELQPAVGEEQGRPQVPGLLRVQRLELLRGPRQVRGLVVGEGEVVADAPVRGRHPESPSIRVDGLPVAAQRGEGRPEVRPALDARRQGEALAVGGHGPLEVARLVQGDGASERSARVPRGSGGHEGQDQERERHRASLAQRIRASARAPPQNRVSVSAVVSRTAFSRARLYPAGA